MMVGICHELAPGKLLKLGRATTPVEVVNQSCEKRKNLLALKSPTMRGCSNGNSGSDRNRSGSHSIVDENEAEDEAEDETICPGRPHPHPRLRGQYMRRQHADAATG
ncbi:hypothetical protein Pelo_2079 [Pelomyxa schiedti]|nr:hypothetical protein Pelo_2079 [Pelomyxa schiedti]